MQDDVCLLQAGLLGWVKEMVLVMVGVLVVEVVEGLEVVEVVEVVREREETRYVPVIVVLTFLSRHYSWK